MVSLNPAHRAIFDAPPTTLWLSSIATEQSKRFFFLALALRSRKAGSSCQSTARCLAGKACLALEFVGELLAAKRTRSAASNRRRLAALASQSQRACPSPLAIFLLSLHLCLRSRVSTHNTLYCFSFYLVLSHNRDRASLTLHSSQSHSIYSLHTKSSERLGLAATWHSLTTDNTHHVI